VLTTWPTGPWSSARVGMMAHRPSPNRKRVRRQVDGRHGVVDSWASARPPHRCGASPVYGGRLPAWRVLDLHPLTGHKAPGQPR
jgi:hypothetical protein